MLAQNPWGAIINYHHRPCAQRREKSAPVYCASRPGYNFTHALRYQTGCRRTSGTRNHPAAVATRATAGRGTGKMTQTRSPPLSSALLNAVIAGCPDGKTHLLKWLLRYCARRYPTVF